MLKRASWFLAGYERAVRLVVERPATCVLQHEDMVDDWSAFKDPLHAAFDLSEQSIRDIGAGSRPNAVEQTGSHKCSGATGDYRRKLTPETAAGLSAKIRTVSGKVLGIEVHSL